jgi:hemerythrin superfamily protein
MAAHASTERASAAPPGRQDAIVYLKAQHREVEALFKEFAGTGDRAFKTRRKVLDRIIVALARHAFIEEQVLYPAARGVPDTGDDVLEALEEHHIVKWELQELSDLDPRDEHFNAKVAVLMENVRHHVGEEESELFPTLRRSMTRKRLVELGDELRARERWAPKGPHPRLPGQPLDQLLPDSVSHAIDRARDMVHSVRSPS